MLEKITTGRFGGRKFIGFLISIGFLASIFVTMLIKGWLNPEYCMRFMGIIPIIIGLFTGGNVLEKYIANTRKGR